MYTEIQETEDRKIPWFSILLFVMLTISILGSYYKFVIINDFVVYAQVTCDPESELCVSAERGEFKEIYMDAIFTPKCDPRVRNSCPELTCELSDYFCSVKP